jgi:hypothetical protein
VAAACCKTQHDSLLPRPRTCSVWFFCVYERAGQAQVGGWWLCRARRWHRGGMCGGCLRVRLDMHAHMCVLAVCANRVLTVWISRNGAYLLHLHVRPPPPATFGESLCPCPSAVHRLPPCTSRWGGVTVCQAGVQPLLSEVRLGERPGGQEDRCGCGRCAVRVWIMCMIQPGNPCVAECTTRSVCVMAAGCTEGGFEAHTWAAPYLADGCCIARQAGAEGEVATGGGQPAHRLSALCTVTAHMLGQAGCAAAVALL